MAAQESASFASIHPPAEAKRVAEAIRCALQRVPQAASFQSVVGRSLLQNHRTWVLDLAYQEYCARLESGEEIDADEFAKRFPGLETSLCIYIEIQRLLANDREISSLSTAVAWPQVGETFLRYRIELQIGAGAFGRVYLAREPEVGDRLVVLKVAPQAHAEASLLGKLVHPNIVPIYSLIQNEEAGLAAFSMPYISRATLHNVLEHLRPVGGGRAKDILAATEAANDQTALPAGRDVARIMRTGSYVDGVIHLIAQLADALSHAHKRGICHRDLKPSNVLIGQDGRPFLLDFNLSVEADLPTQKIGGTLPYMAPEELEGVCNLAVDSGAHYYDPRSDIYSLAVIAYEMLTGRLPFGVPCEGESIRATAQDWHARQKNGPVPLRSLNREVDRPLADVIERCLASEPDDRFETAEQFAAELQRQLRWRRRTARTLRQHPKFVAITSLVVMLAMLATLSYYLLRPAYHERQFAAGLAYLKKGENRAAVEALNEALFAENEYPEALQARGTAFLHLGEFSSALSDFGKVVKQKPSALACAGEAYCLSNTKLYEASIKWYQAALDSGFSNPAILYNNLGASQLRLNKLPEAEASLSKALQYNCRLQAAHANMMIVRFQQLLAGRHVSANDLQHVQAALELGSPGPRVYGIGAGLYAAVSKDDPQLVPKVIEYTQKAIESGYSRQFFETASCFAPFKQNPAFQTALAKKPKANPTPDVPFFLDPLDQ